MADPVKNSSNSNSFIESAYQGAVWGDLSDDSSGTKTATQIGVGLIPGVGQVADARDTYAALGEVQDGKPGGWTNLAFAAIGWVPLAGDFIKSARKIGVRGTVDAVRESLSSVKQTWRDIKLFPDSKSGESSRWWYKPSTETDAGDLGALGTTNRYGDIEVMSDLDAAEKKLTLNHEKVHQFLSPKFLPLQDLRANVRLLGYAESHLLRRVEEGLAESWAQFKSEGLSGLKKGWAFPYVSGGYNINPDRVRTERDILIGVGTSAATTAATVGGTTATTPTSPLAASTTPASATTATSTAADSVTVR